jgi:hypothetical protein
MENRSMTSKKGNDMPFNTPNKIISQSREQSYTFDKNTYVEKYLSHLISQEDYEEIILGASKTMGRSWGKKKKNDQIKLPKSISTLALASVAFSLLYMILIYFSSISADGTGLLIVSIISVVIGMAIAFGLAVYSFCKDIGKFRPLDEIIKQDVDAYLSTINRKWSGKLHFEYNSNKRWLEINIMQPVSENF